MGRSGLVGRELVPHPWECEFKPRIHGVPKEDLSQNNWEAGTTLAKLYAVDHSAGHTISLTTEATETSICLPYET